MVYEPREDSYFLQKFVSGVRGRVLDMGTGTGVQAEEAAKTADVVAVDIDPEALKIAKRLTNVKVIKSDLFSNVEGEFDAIISNAPYLPTDKKHPDVALDGGKHGYEWIWRFLEGSRKHLAAGGRIVLLCSSLSKKEKVEEGIQKYGYVFRVLGKKNLFGEILYVYEITQHPVLAELNVADLELLAQGKRSLVYTGLFGKKVAIKIKHPRSKAVARISVEAEWLRKMNEHGIGPRYIASSAKFVMYEFVDGEKIGSYLEHCSGKDALRVFRNVMKQCRIMDAMKVDKEEMHHPVKHVLISKRVVLIDFERCHKVKLGKNVTQFVQFLVSGNVERHLKKKKIKLDREKLLEAAKWYKKDQSDKNMNQILKLVKSNQG